MYFPIMNERFLPVDNIGGRHQPKGIVVHSMAQFIRHEGDEFAAYKWLERIGLSEHLLVHPTGDVNICVDPRRIAWHAKGHNTGNVGVAFLVPGLHDYGTFVERIKEPWPKREQLLSGAFTLAWLMNEFDITDNVRRHSDIDPRRKVDPGEGFPFFSLLHTAQTLRAAINEFPDHWRTQQ